MLIYWLLLAFPALGAIASARGERSRSMVVLLFMVLFWVFYNAMSGLRFNTGGDWYTYNIMVETIDHESLEFALKYGDMAFTAMVWLMTRLGLGIYGVNMVCSMLLSWGVIALARRTPDPWLAIAAAVPYLMIVVGFGYIRQGAAIGLSMLAINAFTDRRVLLGGVYIGLAVLFHIAAIVVLPVVGIVLVRRSFSGMLVVGLIGFVVMSYALSDARVNTFEKGYIERGYASGGAGVRLLMNVLPAGLFLLRRKVLDLDPRENAIWTGFAVASLLCFAAFYLSPSSTAVDRIGLFFSPIQVFMFGYFLRALQEEGRLGAVLVIVALAYLVAVQFVWLVYATHAEFWVPYRSIFDRVQGL